MPDVDSKPIQPLIHIGYYKSGTSWLQRNVFEQPGSGFGGRSKGEPKHPIRRFVAEPLFGFDAAAWRHQFAELLADPVRQGLVPTISWERLAGHPFSGGWDAKLIAERLAEVFPDGRVLIVAREQRRMIASVYKQYVHAGGPCSVRDFLRPRTSSSRRVPPFELRYFEYEHLLEHYQGLFGPERVLALTLEQLAEDARAFVRQIGSFAGARCDDQFVAGLPVGQPANAAIPPLARKARRVVNKLVYRSALNPAPIATLAGGESFAGRVERLVGRRTRRFPFNDALDRRLVDWIEQEVGDRFAESNRRFATLTGIDVGALGWTV
ncbi:MAG TPA: sulfotransferase [Gaiellaceae bacterium]|nr:sulfotransferase [Gaiellaceae bacterium]